jgi:hypothetical protein
VVLWGSRGKIQATERSPLQKTVSARVPTLRNVGIKALKRGINML